MSDRDDKNRALIEIAKRSAEFKENYGSFWGGIIQLGLADRVVGRRPFLWGGLASLGTLIAGLLVKYGMALLGMTH